MIQPFMGAMLFAMVVPIPAVNGGVKMRHFGGVKIPHSRLGSLST
jgi:hypothetical protein